MTTDYLSDLWGILENCHIMPSSSERSGGGHSANTGAHYNDIQFEN
jgi:hypothetical protein